MYALASPAGLFGHAVGNRLDTEFVDTAPSNEGFGGYLLGRHPPEGDPDGVIHALSSVRPYKYEWRPDRRRRLCQRQRRGDGGSVPPGDDPDRAHAEGRVFARPRLTNRRLASSSAQSARHVKAIDVGVMRGVGCSAIIAR